MGKQWKQWQTLFWGGLKITADGDCSHEIKRHLLLGKKVMTNIKKMKIMAYSPTTSWQIDVETARDFIFLGSKITADGDYSHEIKRCLLLGRKAMPTLDSLLKAKTLLC